MRDEKRIKPILELIEKIWASYPDLRFGQLLINLGLIKDEIHAWNYEDEELEKHLMEISSTWK